MRARSERATGRRAATASHEGAKLAVRLVTLVEHGVPHRDDSITDALKFLEELVLRRALGPVARHVLVHVALGGSAGEADVVVGHAVLAEALARLGVLVMAAAAVAPVIAPKEGVSISVRELLASADGILTACWPYDRKNHGRR